MDKIELKRYESNNFNDCFKYDYEFVCDNITIKFFQAGNRDLYFVCKQKEYTKQINIDITKEKNYDLYEVFSKLYDNIMQIRILKI